MKNLPKKLWNILDGRKTWIGVLLAVIYSGLVAQGVIARDESVEWLIMAVTGVGVGHKIVKS
jgi:hypothetical protein